MGGKAKSRCQLSMLKLNNLRHSYLTVKKLGNYGTKVKCFTNGH